MKELFYANLDVEKSLQFNHIIQEIEQYSDIIILNLPDKVKVNHTNSKGDFHIGYEHDFVTFYYKSFIFYIQSATHYPFTDENDPGLFNFVAYRRVGSAHKVQITYATEYINLSSINTWLHNYTLSKYPELFVPQRIYMEITERIAGDIATCVRHKGGFREQEIMRAEPLFIPSETWNKEHKVITVVDPIYHNSFQFDIVTNKICG